MRVLAVVPTLGHDVVRLNGAIESLRTHSGVDTFEIVVVNNSGLPTIPGLAPVNHVYSPGVNLGYVGALEVARRRYPCDFLWSIQDDMALKNDVLAALITVMHGSPRIAVASPVLIRDGFIPARTRAGVFTNPQRTRWENFPPIDTAPAELPIDVDYSFVSGSGALFRSAALSGINGFNLDLYPLMHVDVDVCTRLRAKGWGLHLEPSAHIDHQIQGSTPRVLGRTLDKRNRAVVEQHLEGHGTDTLFDFDPIDPGVLFDVARRASFLFLEVSREAESRLQEVNSQLQESETRLQAVETQLHEAESQFAGVRQTIAALVTQRDALVAERDWWHGQFQRLRERRSVRCVLTFVAVLRRMSWSAHR